MRNLKFRKREITTKIVVIITNTGCAEYDDYYKKCRREVILMPTYTSLLMPMALFITHVQMTAWAVGDMMMVKPLSISWRRARMVNSLEVSDIL